MPTKGGVHVKWVGDRVVDKMGKKLSRNADVVGLFLQKKVRQKISTGQPVKRTAGGRTVGTTPAKPGAPPRLLMGGLRRSIDYDKKKKARAKKIIITIGAHTEYARKLELGPGKHPYLRSTIAENKRAIVKKLMKGLVP